MDQQEDWTRQGAQWKPHAFKKSGGFQVPRIGLKLHARAFSFMRKYKIIQRARRCPQQERLTAARRGVPRVPRVGRDRKRSEHAYRKSIQRYGSTGRGRGRGWTLKRKLKFAALGVARRTIGLFPRRVITYFRDGAESGNDRFIGWKIHGEGWRRRAVFAVSDRQMGKRCSRCGEIVATDVSSAEAGRDTRGGVAANKSTTDIPRSSSLSPFSSW